MAIKILSDIVTVVSEHIANPSTSEYDIFVGLEHYDAGEPVITRYGSTAQLESSVKHFNEGDILVARRNVYLKRAGVVKFEGVTSGDSIVLRVKDERYKAIIPFLLNTEEFWDYAEQNSDGTMSKRLAPDVLLEYECDIPDNHKEIADKLWAAYELKEAYKKMIAATDEMVKSQFIEMFGACTHNVYLSTLCNVFIDGDWIESKDQSDVGIRLIQTGNIGDGYFRDKDDKARYISEQTFEHLKCTEVFPNDILISRLPDPIGRACVIPDGIGKSITAVDCTIVRLSDKILPEFFVAYTKTPMYQRQINEVATGTTRRRVSRANLGNIKITCPSLDKQQQFVDIVNQADKSKFELRQAIEKIDKVMKSLLQ